jgi:3-dehydroquinate synthase
VSRPTRIEVPLGDRAYEIVVGSRLLGDLDSAVSLPEGASRALVVTQAPVVAAGHVAPVEAALRRAGVEVVRHEVPDGERAKDVEVLAGLWQACAEVPLTRSDVIIAVGGGVVGDLAGFAAASFNRGIAVMQVPTTLLAQVDAAIGGKTGINLPQGKNLVGAFHQPTAVVCDVDTLRTLPERVRVEGMGEVVKYGLIRDPSILHLLEERLGGPAGAGSGVADPLLLEELVRRSAAVKAAVVAADEREGGERAHLNLGHTFGHAVETLTGYDQVLHGEAVAIGTVMALRLGVLRGRTPQGLADRAERLLERLGLPVRPPVLDRDAVWEVMRRDKKAGRDGVRFVLVAEPGECLVEVPPAPLVDAVIDGLETS